MGRGKDDFASQLKRKDCIMWIVYVSQGRAEFVGQKVFESDFYGVAQKYADRRNELSQDDKLPERYSVRFEE